MKKSEFSKWFYAEVACRWTGWEVERHALDDWYHIFGKYDFARLTTAVRKHLVRDSTKTPNTKILLKIIGSLSPPSQPKSRAEKKDYMTVKQIWEHIRANFSREKRIELIREVARFNAELAKKYDPQAYEWSEELRVENEENIASDYFVIASEAKQSQR